LGGGALLGRAHQRAQVAAAAGDPVDLGDGDDVIGQCQARIVMRVTRSPSTWNVKWDGPLNPRPPTCALTVVSSPEASTPSTSSATSTPMNSLSLQPVIASAPRNSRPQSSTTPSGV